MHAKTGYSFYKSDMANTAADFFSSDENYEYCPHCNRKFFLGRLKLHLKSCKEGKPLKPVKSRIDSEPAEETKDKPNYFGIELNNEEAPKNNPDNLMSFRDMPVAKDLAENNLFIIEQEKTEQAESKFYEQPEEPTEKNQQPEEGMKIEEKNENKNENENENENAGMEINVKREKFIKFLREKELNVAYVDVISIPTE